MMYEYGGVRNKSREEAIMIQDVMGERCARGRVNTTLEAFDGINAFNTVKKEHKEELFRNSVYHLAVKDQNMKHATFVQGSDTTCLLEPHTGTAQGGPKATDIYNKGLRNAMEKILKSTIEISPMMNGNHPYLFEAADPITMTGTPKKVQCATTSFVDDIINRVANKDMQKTKGNTEAMDKIIEEELNKRNVYLNKSKEQPIWNLHGKGAMMMKAQIYSNEEHGIGDHLRYLGPQLEENGRCQVEVTLRIVETHTQFLIITKPSGPNQQN